MPPTTVLSQSESSFITSSLLLPEPIRTDGRALLDYRPFSLSTGVAPQANGSARAQLAGGTDVVTAVRLEVLERPQGLGKEEGSSVGGRVDVVCNVECSPSAFPTLDSKALDVQSTYLTTLVQQTIPPLLPALPITSSLSFHYTIDVLISSTTSGNVLDTLFLSLRAALSDLKVPRTKNVAYEAGLSTDEQGESDMAGIKGAALGGGKKRTGVDRKKVQALARGAEFEIEDYWDEGDRLKAEVRAELPVCVTLNVLPNGTHFLDATLAESLASPTHLILFVSGSGKVSGMRFIGSTEVGVQDLKQLIHAGKNYAANMIAASDAVFAQPSIHTSGGLGYFAS